MNKKKSPKPEEDPQKYSEAFRVFVEVSDSWQADFYQLHTCWQDLVRPKQMWEAEWQNLESDI